MYKLAQRHLNDLWTSPVLELGGSRRPHCHASLPVPSGVEEHFHLLVVVRRLASHSLADSTARAPSLTTAHARTATRSLAPSRHLNSIHMLRRRRGAGAQVKLAKETMSKAAAAAAAEAR